MVRAIQGEEPRSVVASEAKPEPQPEEESKQTPRIESACFQLCMRCKAEAISFCASCGGDLCAKHDSAAHSAVDTSSHARVLQADKSAFLKAIAEGSESAFHKSAESCKASVQGVLHTLVEVETRLKTETKDNEGQSKQASKQQATRFVS